MALVKLSLDKLTIPQKVQKFRQIITAMTGNPNVPTADPPLPELTTATDGLETAFNEGQAARLASKQKTDVQDAKEKIADAAFTKEAGTVQNATGGDPVKIQSTGMEIRDPSDPIGDLGQAQNFSVTAGDNDGELDAACDRLNGAKSYEYQVSADPPTSGSWVHKATATKSSATLGGLASGSKTWARVRGIGAAGPGPWSDPASKVVP